MYEWRLIIGPKWKEANARAIYVILKSLLSPSHKIRRSWMVVWMEDSSLDLMTIWQVISNWTRPLNLILKFTSLTLYVNPRVSWVWEFNPISLIIGLIKWMRKWENWKKKVSGRVGVRLLEGGVRPLWDGVCYVVQ